MSVVAGRSGDMCICISCITEHSIGLVYAGDVQSAVATSGTTTVAVSCWGADRGACSPVIVGPLTREA